MESDDFAPSPGAAEQHARYPKQRALCQAGKVIKRLRLVAHELARQRFPAELRIGQHRPVVGDRLHDRLPIRAAWRDAHAGRSEEHTSELQSLMRISYAVFCLKKKKTQTTC